MTKSKKIDIIGLVILGVLVISVILTIVGVCIDWTTSTTTVVGQKGVTNTTLAKWAENNSNMIEINDNGYEGYGAMAAFAYITLALTILTTLVFVVSKFVDVKVLKWVLVGVAALTVVSAIVMIATTYGFCGNLTNEKYGSWASAKTAPAAGPWLLFVFSLLCGGAGVAGALKK